VTRRLASQRSCTTLRRSLVVAAVAGLWLVVLSSNAAQTDAKNSTGSGVTVRTLAQGPVKALPAGNVFVGILDFRQVPGVACGPTCQLPGFVYTLTGNATISLPGGSERSVNPGDAAFTSELAAHTNDKVEGRVGTGAIAVGLIVVVILLGAATWLRVGRRRAVIPVLSLLLIGGGALVLSGVTSNEWYYFAVRPGWQRNLPMPRPDGRVFFVSPDLDPLPAAPYVERLRAITVAPGARYDAPSLPGPETFIIVEGTAAVQIGDATRQLGRGAGALAQAGKTVAIVNPGNDTLQVLDFAVTPVSAASPAT
jgi:quercetin dioxygenase-like cupin family protein